MVVLTRAKPWIQASVFKDKSADSPSGQTLELSEKKNTFISVFIGLVLLVLLAHCLYFDLAPVGCSLSCGGGSTTR